MLNVNRKRTVLQDRSPSRGKNERPDGGLPCVSIVIPVKNEGPHIARALDGALGQTYPREQIEVIVVDGGSSDETCEIVRGFMVHDQRVKLLGGEGLNCPMAMNVGIAHSQGDIVAKIDGHGYLEAGAIELAVRTLLSDDLVACVGGRIVPGAPRSGRQRANACARFSRFAVGRGVYTEPATIHFVDTVQCGVYRKRELAAVGLFDEDLQFGEDEEVNWRLVRAGKRIVFHPDIRFHYQVRPTFGAIWRQYRNYGRARVDVIRKHREFLKVKHCMPAVLVVALIISGIAGVAISDSGRLALLPWGAYLVFVMAGGISIGLRAKYVNIPFLCVSLMSIHTGYGVGFIQGVVGVVCRVLRRGRREG